MLFSHVIPHTGLGDGVTLWTPEYLDTTAWYDTSDASTITESAGAVSQLDDKSGNTRNLTQTTGADQPITGTRTIGGLNVFDYNNTDYLQTDSVDFYPASNNLAVFLIAEIDSVSENLDCLLSMNGGNDWQFESNSSPNFGGSLRTDLASAGSPFNCTDGPYNGPSIYNLNFDWGSSFQNVFIDGTKDSGVGDALYDTSPGGSMRLLLATNRGIARFMNVGIGEVIICEDVTTATRQKIEGYLAWKWGLVDNLPSDHPYKNAAPIYAPKALRSSLVGEGSLTVELTLAKALQASLQGDGTMTSALAILNSLSTSMTGDGSLTGDIAPLTAINNSLMLDSASSQYGDYTPTAGGDRKTWTLNAWVKLGALGANNDFFGTVNTAGNPAGERLLVVGFNSSGKLFVDCDTGAEMSLYASPSYRDPSAWYHVLVSVDTTQTTASDRVKIYVNGVQVTDFDTETYPSQNKDLAVNYNHAHYIGRDYNSYFDGYLAHTYVIDGQALTPSSFGETDATTGQWVPKAFSGSYGSRDRFYKFEDSADLGEDSSGNSLDMTLNGGIGSTNQTVDTPIDNFCVLNPLHTSSGTLSEGNLKSTGFGIGTINCVDGNAYYWEVPSRATAPVCGVISEDGATTHTTTVTANKAFGFRITAAGNLDYINITDAGSWTSITTGLTGTWFPHSTSAAASEFDFGQLGWVGTPSGSALSTGNLADPAIDNPADYFDVVEDTGANIKTTADALFSGEDYWAWIKDKANSQDHQYYDTVRGITNILKPNTTGGNTTYTAPSGNSVAWVARIAALAGIDVVSDTMGSGSTSFAHGLGKKPGLLMAKTHSTTGNWNLTHKDQGLWSAQTEMQDTYSYLNTTARANTSNNIWGGEPTDSLFYLDNPVVGNGAQFIAILMASVPGFLDVGYWYGNGNADGPFVNMGFLPRWVLFHRVSSNGANWFVMDTKRSTVNPLTAALYPNEPFAQSVNVTWSIDAVSNGLKIRTSDASLNGSGQYYCYAAIAEAPFKYANAR
jgi:hypothetical protein